MTVNITLDMVKELRERTGVGMAKCKEALVVGEGDMQKAIDHLRKTGISSAVKKAAREAKEGYIGVCESKDAVALVEMNAETDFVAGNEKFKEFLQNMANQAALSKPSSLDVFLEEIYAKDNSLTVDHYRNLLTQRFGENIVIKQVEVISKPANASFGVYSHMGGKLVTVVQIDGAKGEEQFAKDLAMHVAAADPEYLSVAEIPAEIIQREKEIAAGQIKGKPENIINKIVEGKLQAFYDEACFLDQKFIKDTSVSVSQYVEAYGKKIGKQLAIVRFWRWKIG